MVTKKAETKERKIFPHNSIQENKTKIQRNGSRSHRKTLNERELKREMGLCELRKEVIED